VEVKRRFSCGCGGRPSARTYGGAAELDPDGGRVRPAAGLYLPQAMEAGDAAPVVLEALPYRKDDATASYRPEYERLYSEFGYAVARVDLRGPGRRRGCRLLADTYADVDERMC
jgi:hypothetical protein